MTGAVPERDAAGYERCGLRHAGACECRPIFMRLFIWAFRCSRIGQQPSPDGIGPISTTGPQSKSIGKDAPISATGRLL